ncbi:MAG: EAL domain-containing protein, partial [Sedimenticola sp.]
MNSDNITLVDLAKAVANDEFVYFYQPQVSMVTGTLSGAEALIRWKKSDTELISPIHFIPLAESSGFIKEITISMISKLIRDMVIINDLNPALTVSFNASAKDFSSPLLVDTIEQAARDHQVNIASLRIELTESVILESDEHTAGNLKRLEELGVGLEMDDFGTGFSSLDMLGQLPFSAVKLDQGIISRMRTSGKNRTIALSSIRMAHSLGMDIVAEGIESRDSYVFLQNAGCTTGQGYWISRPLPLDKYLAFSSKERHWPALRLGLFHMAQLDHIQWRKALMESVFFRSFSEGERSSVDPIIAANDHDHTTCRLGKWYYGQKLEYAGNSLFDALEEPHRRLHEIGR